jgi:TruD family tRNA pseudouridine synthase
MVAECNSGYTYKFGMVCPAHMENKLIRANLFVRESDFIVEEIIDNETLNISKIKNRPKPIAPCKFAQFTLVKTGISTFDAAKMIAERFSVPEKSIGYCGLKDNFAVTAQRISIPCLQHTMETSYKFKDFFLKDGTPAIYPVSKDMHSGNHFRIKIYPKEVVSAERFSELKRELASATNEGIPNFYGVQRFGSRGINHIVGMELLKRNFEKAAKIWLTNTYIKWDLGKAISNLWGNWDECASVVSRRAELNMEHRFFNMLSANSGDFVDAFGSIPLGKFLIRSYSSYVFNKILSELLAERIEIKNLTIPMVGTKIALGGMKHRCEEVMAEDDIDIKMFDFGEDTRLSNEGRMRDAAFYPKDLIIKKIDKNNNLGISFSNKNGSFATILLGLFFDYKFNPGAGNSG